MGQALSCIPVRRQEKPSEQDPSAAAAQEDASPEVAEAPPQEAPKSAVCAPSTESNQENVGDLNLLVASLPGLPNLGLPSTFNVAPSSSSSSTLSASSGSREPGTFGKWAIQTVTDGHGSFYSATQLARRHARPGASERSRIAGLLNEHNKQKFSSVNHFLLDKAPALEGHSPSAALDILLLLRLVAALEILVNGRVSMSHVQMLAVLLAVGRHVRVLQSSSRIMGRDLLTELHDALPDQILLAFRAKLNQRLRSEAGMASVVKMVKLIPTVIASSRDANASRAAKLPTRHTVPGIMSTGGWGSIMDSQSSMSGLLDSRTQDILDSAYSMSSVRPPLAPGQTGPPPQARQAAEARGRHARTGSLPGRAPAKQPGLQRSLSEQPERLRSSVCEITEAP